MSQDWPSFNFGAGQDTVKEAIEGLRDRTNDLRTNNNGSSAPTGSLNEGMLWWNTVANTLKILHTISPVDWRIVPVAGQTTFDDTWLAANCVTTVKILDANVTEGKLATDSVTSAKIAALAVTTAKINALAVTSAKLAANAVTTAKILDANVTTAKILDANVTTAKIADTAVTAAKLGAGAVTTDKINDGAVTAAKLASGLSLLWSTVAKSGTYTAASGQLVIATAGTSWTLSLPASPSANARVGVYLAGVTGTSVLTVDGGSKSIGQGGTTLNMYVYGDRLELVYSGTAWVVVGGELSSHICSIQQTGMTRAAPGISFQTIAYNTTLQDRGGLQNVAANRIDIRRSGNYRIRLQALFGQVAPLGWVFRMLKNGAALSPRMMFLNISDYYQDGTLDLVGPDWVRTYYLTAGDYIQADYYYYLYASADNQSILSVEEWPVII